MDAKSLEKQKKGNLYVYKFGPITVSGSRTPDHHPHPPRVAVTKRIIPSSMWAGLRKSKSKPKPKPDLNLTEVVKKDSKEKSGKEDGNGNGNGSELGMGMGKGGRKSVSSVEAILMSLAEGRKSVSVMEEGKGKGMGFPLPEEERKGGRKSISHMENSMAYVGRFVEEKGRKSTGAKVENNVKSAIELLQVKVLVTDMPGFMQVHAFQCARNTYDSLEIFSAKHLAYNLKKEFDKIYGPAWHCIVGSSFGSFVTHATGCFLYFSMEKLCILLFRTKVQRALQQ